MTISARAVGNHPVTHCAISLRAIMGLIVLLALAAYPVLAQEQAEALFLQALADADQATRLADGPQRDRLLTDAATGLQTLLADNPDLALPRLELARVRFLQGQDRLARIHFTQVLAESDPPPPVAANIERYLATLHARRKWRGAYGLSITTDTNINTQSEHRTVTIDQFCFWGFGCIKQPTVTIPPRVAGTGVRLWATGTYQHPLDDATQLHLGGRIDRTEYAGSAFDRMTLSAYAGPHWQFGPRTDTRLLAVATRAYEANRPVSRDLGARLEVRHPLDPMTGVVIHLAHLERRHDNSPTLDGPLTDLTVSLNRVLGPTLRGTLAVSGFRQRPDASIADRKTGRSLDVGLAAVLPTGLGLDGTLSLARTDYDDTTPFVAGGAQRADTTRTARLRITHRDAQWMGFVPDVTITHTKRTSNDIRGGYRRTSLGLNLVRSF
ncbi:MAG: surface lipoprotein assembly modifier [Rhodobacteraceae bacterium]|nr:surface lipoprotein assembly modifier [Paracoccaceae bacterium]MCY4326028.1 surface lipoprotein assembly modifier [Paracoccaceae bacterium]